MQKTLNGAHGEREFGATEAELRFLAPSTIELVGAKPVMSLDVFCAEGLEKAVVADLAAQHRVPTPPERLRITHQCAASLHVEVVNQAKAALQ